MTLPEQRWLKAVVLATALVFAGVALYLYAFRFFDWVESDAAVTAVLGGKALHAMSPVVADWYYANGDVWMAAPHLIAILPVGILGVGPASLLIAVLLGFALELYAFTKAYARLCGERWIAMFATLVTMMAWSSAHVAFGYIQLSYAFLTMLCMVTFAVFAALAERPPSAGWRWVLAGALITFLAVQNPTRTLAFVFAPILAACLWAWRDVSWRRRLPVMGVAIVGWGVAYVIYAKVFAHLVTFSQPRGHLDFVLVGLDGIKTNLGRMATGIGIMFGGGSEPSIRMVPGTLLVIGALVLVIRHVLASRELTAMRFVCVAMLAQLGIVMVPLVVGNLLVDIPSIRYLMPSLLELMGLAAILATREVATAAPAWLRKLAIGWLALIPLAAVLAIPEARPPAPKRYVWPNVRELEKVADELVRRDLTHGFSIVLSANLLTLDTHAHVMTCPVYFSDHLVPQRWLADTSCFDKRVLPETYFVVADQTEQDRKALRTTLPPPIERFTVGDTYEIDVYRKADTRLDWLDLPLPEGKEIKFPLHIPATHLQLAHANVVQQGDDLVATGEGGTVIYGPYLKMPRGVYEVTWFGSAIDSPGQIAFNVTADGGADLFDHVVHDAKGLGGGTPELAKLTFKLDRTRENIEFLVQSGGGGKVAIHEIVIVRKR